MSLLKFGHVVCPFVTRCCHRDLRYLREFCTRAIGTSFPRLPARFAGICSEVGVWPGARALVVATNATSTEVSLSPVTKHPWTDQRY